MIGWHQQLNGHEFEQILGDSEGQGNLELAATNPEPSWGRNLGQDLEQGRGSFSTDWEGCWTVICC